jgi:hypothetical protein
MKTPKYYVSLGGVNLHCVTSFELSSDRDIDTYDGIGSGRFNVPDAHNPREWTIECELLQSGKDTVNLNTWSASELFKCFENWLQKTDAPIRMVKTDAIYPAANLSVLVWLKSYKPKESDDQGVYDTEIVVEEYKPVGIKTTGIPTVSRPGKVPVPPKVTITKKSTVYSVKKKYGGGVTLKNPKTGKPPANAATMTPGVYSLKMGSAAAPVRTTEGAAVSVSVEPSKKPASLWDNFTNWVGNTFSWIGNGLKEAGKRQQGR